MAWLFKQPGSENYWIGQRVNGRQIRKSTGTSDETEAKKLLAQVDTMTAAQRAGRLTEDVYRALTGAQISAVSLKAAVKQWHDAKAQSWGDKTAERYEDVSGQFMVYVKADATRPLLRDITTATVTGFLNHSGKTLSRGSLIVSRKILSGFWNWCIKAKLTNENPVKATSLPKERKHEKVTRRAFTKDELKALWASAPDDFWRYMNTGGLYTGLRMGDLICLTKGEVDLVANRLRQDTIKTGTVVEIPIAAPFCAILEPLVKKCRGKYLWPKEAALYQRKNVGAGPFSNDFYEKVMTPAGLVPKRNHLASKKAGDGRRKKHTQNEVSFHSFRHTFVSMLKTSGVSQSVAKALAGHASDRISDLYTHVSPEHMQQAIKQLPEVGS